MELVILLHNCLSPFVENIGIDRVKLIVLWSQVSFCGTTADPDSLNTQEPKFMVSHHETFADVNVMIFECAVYADVI